MIDKIPHIAEAVGQSNTHCVPPPQLSRVPIIIPDLFLIGPVFMYVRIELIISDCVFIRFDYLGTCEMYYITPRRREYTGVLMRVVRFEWATLVSDIPYFYD